MTAETNSKPKKKILFIINSLAGGGAERVMSTLLKASEREHLEFDLQLVLLDRDPAAYAIPTWVTVRQFDCSHSLIRSVLSLWRCFKDLNPDLVLSFLTRANVAAIAAGALVGTRVVVSERVNTSSHLGRGLGAAITKILVRWTYPKAEKVIAVSSGVAEDLVRSFGVPEAKLIAIANPIDREAILAKSEEDTATDVTEPYVIAMGRLVPNKNFGLLIEAFARSGIGGRLRILGEGPERPNLMKMVSDRGLSDRVDFPGFSNNPFPQLRRARLFVLCSNAEGFPNSLLEAMSVGIPVISTNCRSGPSEVLANLPREKVTQPVCFAEYGVIVPTEAPDAMAEALRAMEDPERRRHYGEKSSIRSAEFSVEWAKNQYWAVLRAALES